MLQSWPGSEAALLGVFLIHNTSMVICTSGCSPCVFKIRSSESLTDLNVHLIQKQIQCEQRYLLIQIACCVASMHTQKRIQNFVEETYSKDTHKEDHKRYGKAMLRLESGNLLMGIWGEWDRLRIVVHGKLWYLLYPQALMPNSGILFSFFMHNIEVYFR